MWNKDELEQAIKLLTSFASELWVINEPENSEQMRKTIAILERQLDMLSDFEK
jgi:hypothetical protein